MSEYNKDKPTVACFGEIIWDSLPQGLFIGGAPYNVAYHLTRIKQPSLMISAVGRDELGRIALEKAEESGIDISCIQLSDTRQTGISDISISENGEASYDIRHPVAWDEITCTQLTKEKLNNCPAFVFGALAARSEISRSALLEILGSYRGLTLCDVNLRSPYDHRDFVIDIASKAQVVKLNEDELFRLSEVNNGSASLEKALLSFKESTNASMIFVTRGKNPAVYFDGDRLIFATPPSNRAVIDTIGAGDAFTAATIQGLLSNISIEECLNRAVILGSFITTQQGAQPNYNPNDVLEGIFF